GASEFRKAIDQLFERYLTWRDSKVALIIFVNQKGFTSVLQTIREEASKHLLHKYHKGDRGESSFSYVFGLPQDQQKDVFIEIMAFHYFQ
ncbi:MAG: hypothetical protein AAF570_05345, partial [Bacteroidota bacterium]